MSDRERKPSDESDRVVAGKGRRRRGRTPEPLGGLVGALLEKWGLTDRVERARAVADWDRLVGPHIARVTGDVRVRGRTLFVEVQSAAWLSELNMMRHQLLRRLNAGRERGRIEKIVFLQAGGGAERQSRGGAERQSRGGPEGRGGSWGGEAPRATDPSDGDE